jgi:two-component sensor histidine kinase
VTDRRNVLDISHLVEDAAPSWTTKILSILGGLALSALLRVMGNLITPGIPPFSFVYPACLLATLCAGWQSGALAALIAGGAAEVLVVPEAVQHGLPMLGATVVAAICAATIILLAQIFRMSVQRALKRGGSEVAERDLLYRELQHRVGNDFNLVHTLLDQQRKRSEDTHVRSALGAAIGRIRSIARVHRQLYSLPEIASVEVTTYLKDLCIGLSDSVLPSAGVTLRCHADQAFMRREIALPLGLITNELITNAVKHAFPDGREGIIDVRFVQNDGGWQLIVADNGVGVSPEPKRGFGTGLIEQMVRQIGGQFNLKNTDGTIGFLTLPKDAAQPASPEK